MLKRGYEFSFVWIFTLIVGAVIIFLAIYAAFQLAESSQSGRNAASAKKIGILLTPFETNLESGKSGPIGVREETTIFNDCSLPSSANPFGSQKISVSVKSDLANQATSPGVQSTFHNKYLFSKNETLGEKEFSTLSKPLNYPFKIADVVMVWSDQEHYCFVGANSDIKDEINDLSLKIQIVDNKDECTDTAGTTVCFTGNKCDINVKEGLKTVEKEGEVLYYDDSFGTDKNALLFAAIFSNPDEYRCQIRRLAAKAENLAELYLTKSINLGSPGGCPNIQSYLEDYRLKAADISSSVNPDIKDLHDSANEIEGVNHGCSIY